MDLADDAGPRPMLTRFGIARKKDAVVLFGGTPEEVAEALSRDNGWDPGRNEVIPVGRTPRGPIWGFAIKVHHGRVDLVPADLPTEAIRGSPMLTA